jgi:hypothetical protein
MTVIESDGMPSPIMTDCSGSLPRAEGSARTRGVPVRDERLSVMTSQWQQGESVFGDGRRSWRDALAAKKGRATVASAIQRLARGLQPAWAGDARRKRERA